MYVESWYTEEPVIFTFSTDMSYGKIRGGIIQRESRDRVSTILSDELRLISDSEGSCVEFVVKSGIGLSAIIIDGENYSLSKE